MINNSLNSGIVSSVLTIYSVVAIQNVAKSLNCADFRPINEIVPVVEKILEIVVKNQLSQYIENNNILIPQQSGFH
jgi:hypothetical protein